MPHVKLVVLVVQRVLFCTGGGEQHPAQAGKKGM